MGPVVFVTDGEQRAALAVTRSLGRARYLVHVGAVSLPSLAGASRWCRGEHAVPDALREPEAFAEAVGRLCSRLGVRVLLPITDASVLAILPRVELLGAACVPFPPLATVRRIADKALVTRMASELGVKVPAQVVLSDRAGTEWLRLRFPLVVKPHRSVFEVDGGATRRKLGVIHVAAPPKLQAVLGSLPPEAFPVLVQERLLGDGVGVFLLLWDGRRLAFFGHRRIREKPPAGGVSVYAESVRVDPDLLGQAERLLRAFDWRGVAMVEFKRDTAGVPHLMEINGRFWGSLQLAIDAGVDFPRLLVDAALGRPVEPVEQYRIGVRTRWWWGEVDHLLARFRRSARTLDLPPGAPGRIRAVWDFAVAGLRRDTRNEVLRLDDPRPALREARDWIRGR